LLSGKSDNNFDFSELLALLKNLNFEIRIKGSHHIVYKEKVEEIINLQPHNNNAKAHQVKQVRSILMKYKLIENNED
jgi:predicted RNA binding protein YcfA (HicA-like mRNA interferase family)